MKAKVGSPYEGQEIKETVLRKLGHRYCVKEKRQEKVGIFRVDTLGAVVDD